MKFQKYQCEILEMNAPVAQLFPNTVQYKKTLRTNITTSLEGIGIPIMKLRRS